MVEAKAEDEEAATGLQQSKDYAEILKLKFAYATNGKEIIEFDYITGLEREIPAFPTPAELWARLRAHEKLTDDACHPPAHALQSLQWQDSALLPGDRHPSCHYGHPAGPTPRLAHDGHRHGQNARCLLHLLDTLVLALESENEPHRKPRILYLADRNFLVDDPKDKTFAPFGDARWKIENGFAVFSRELYFATYQSIAQDERRPGLYKEFAPDFFDLIIVDECHRGSAREESNWREILEYFAPAYQLGMTATPLRDDNRDTYLYFGNPIYTYSLRQGIDDGFPRALPRSPYCDAVGRRRLAAQQG